MKKYILLAMVGLSEIYEKELSDELREIWLNVLGDLTQDEVNRAVIAYVRDPKNVFFPKPGQIYGLARPQPDIESQAQLIADCIFSAVRSYGTDKVGEDRARLKIGEVGWQYIATKGGWSVFSNSIKSDDDIPILQSQARKSIMGLIQARTIDMPMLPDGRPVTLKSLGVEMKQLK